MGGRGGGARGTLGSTGSKGLKTGWAGGRAKGSAVEAKGSAVAPALGGIGAVGGAYENSRN